MEDLEDVFLTPMPDSPYVKPFRFNYRQNGRAKTWDLLEVHDSVAVIVFNVTRKVLVLVKQFRPAVYYNSISPADRTSMIDTNKYPAKLGITLEMCAGIVDKALPLEEVAREELLEECGYDVPVSALQRVLTYRSGVGASGATQSLFYCEVTDEMKRSAGGGVDDELIDVVEMSAAEAERMLEGAGSAAAGVAAGAGALPCPPSALLALLWFLRHKPHVYAKSYELHCGECKSPPPKH